MSKAVKAAGLGLVIFVTVWSVTLWRWHRSQASIGTQELVGQLLALPAAVTLVAWLVWFGAGRLRAWLSQPVPSKLRAPLPTMPAEHVPSESSASAMPLPCVRILAESVCLPHADSADVAWSKLASAGLRPGLDPLLRDADGWPIFASRVPDLDTQDWLAAHAEFEGRALPEGVLRSLALLERPWHELMAALPSPSPKPSRSAHAGDAAQGHAQAAESGPTCLSGVGQAGAAQIAALRRDQATELDIQVWLPAAWAAEHRDQVVAWLRQQAGPALDWVRASGGGEPRWSVQALEAPEAGWDALSEALRHLPTSPRPRALLVLAAHSLVDADVVEAMQARGELFTGTHQGGRVPGEGAAGLLLANLVLAEAAPQGVPDPSPWLGTPAAARRQRSADRAGRPGADELVRAIRQAMEMPPTQDDAPGTSLSWWCVADADHRAGRVSELFEAVQLLQPEADPSLAVHRVGDAWGDLGVARALVPVALAASALRHGLSPDLGGAPADATPREPGPAVVTLSQCDHRRWAIPVWPADLPARPTVERADAPEALAA